MLGLDTAFLNQITREKFIPAVKNQIYNSSPLWARLWGAGRVKTMNGTQLSWRVILKKHQSVGRYTGYDTFANQPVNPVVTAYLTEGSYYAALAISGTEKRKNTGSMEKLLDAVKVQHDNALETLQEMLYTDIFGDGSLVGGRQGIIGLAAAIDSDNTYAGIDRSAAANAGWRANVDATTHALADIVDPTTTHYLPNIMRRSHMSAVHQHAPNLIVTTKDVYNKYEDIAGIQHLQFDNTMADMGFGGVKFKNVTMVFDDFCPSGYMWMINDGDWTVWVLPGANFEMPEEGWMRPANQDALVTQILFSGQLRLDSPRHQSVMTTIQTS